MRTAGLIASISRLNAMSMSYCGRHISTDSVANNHHEPFKVEKSETVNLPPPSKEKLLVLGGDGFVDPHICREALDRGFAVTSLSRSGRSSLHDSWANNVIWHKGNLLSTDSWKEALNGITAFISCVGGFGSNSYLYMINGTANINAIRAASKHGVRKFVYISAADFCVVNYLLKGYYEGKCLMILGVGRLCLHITRDFDMDFPGVILRPGFIYGTRIVGIMKLPLGIIGSPLERVLKHVRPLTRIPFLGPLFTPPVSVKAVAEVAVRAAADLVLPPGIIDVYGIQHYSKVQSK